RLLLLCCLVGSIRQLLDLMHEHATKSTTNLNVQDGFVLRKFSISLCFWMHFVIKDKSIRYFRATNLTLMEWSEKTLNATELIQSIRLVHADYNGKLNILN